MMSGSILWLCMLGCPWKKPEKPPVVLEQGDIEEIEKQAINPSGTIVGGVFRDRSFPLEGEVDDEWLIVLQAQSSARRFQAKHREMDITVEIWSFSETLIDPPKYNFCRWEFIDRGFYESTQKKKIRSTCVPKQREDAYVFAEIHHWKGGTWLFEIHTSMEYILTGKKKGEQLLRRFTWYDEIER